MVLILLVSLASWNLLWIYHSYRYVWSEVKTYRSNYLNSQKDLIKSEVETAFSYIGHMREKTEERLRESIRDRVNQAVEIAANLYRQNKDTKPDDEIKTIIKDTLRPIRFNNGRGYYFAFNLQGIEELFADRPELEGVNMLPVQGGKGEFVVRDMIDLVKQKGGGFYRYTWTKPGRGDVYFPKIAYVRMFEPYGWVIGTGEYIDDVEAEIKNEVISRLVAIRFGEEGYFFGSTYDGNPLFSNGKTTKGTNNIWDLTDPNGVKIIQEQIKAAQKPEGGFVLYSWNKLGSKENTPKISYVIGIPEWRWVIGTGAYVGAIEDHIKAWEKDVMSRLRRWIVQSALIMLGLLALVIFWVSSFSKKISLNLTAFSKFFQKSAAESTPIKLEEVNLIEFAELAGAANKMLLERQAAMAGVKESEEKLSESNQILSGILEHTHMMAVLLDPTFNFIWVNRAYADTCGYDPSFFMGKNHFELYPHEENQAIFQRVVETKEPFFIEAKPFEYPDQPERGITYWDWSLIPTIEESGKVSGLVLTLMEVTKRIRTEESLRRSELQHRTILTTAVDGFWLLDKSGRILEVNEAYTRMSGYTQEELLNMNISDLEAFESTTEIISYIRQITESGSDRFETRQRRKDGSTFEVEVSVQYQPTTEGLLVAFIRDITERKLAEDRLRTSEERYRDIAKAQTGIIWEIDENYMVRHFSGRVSQIMGYEPEEIIGRHPLFLVAPEDREQFETALARFPQEREPVRDFEYWCQAKDGRRVRVSTIGVSFFSTEGQFLGVRGTHLDITDAYLAHLRRDVLLKIHTMIDYNDEAISEFLCQACAEQTNSPIGFFGMVESEESAMVAQVWSPLAMAECRIPDKPIRFKVESAGLWADPIRRREPVIINDYSSDPDKGGLPEGHVPITRYLGVPIVEGNEVIALAGVANKETEYDDRDIENLTLITSNVAAFLSERRKDKSLKESEKRYRLTFEAIPDSITITRVKDGKYKYVNNGYTNLTGYTREEVIGKTPQDIDLYFDPEARQRMMKELKEKGILQNFEVQFRKKDGTVWDSFFSARPIELDGENCLIALAKDVTELKKAELEKRSLETQLRQAQKMEAIGTLAGGIAHDFNNILTAIIGYTELTMEDMPEGIPIRPNLERIHIAALRARDLVKQILSFSRQTEHEKRLIKVELIVKETLKLLRATIPTTIEIHQEIEPNIGLVEADPTQIHQLILNLGTNAADAMKETGGILTVRLDEAQIGQAEADSNIELESGRYLKITVQDTGPGIQMDIMDRIFDPFFTTKEVGAGTGMGLSVVHGIVQGLGGAITVNNVAGKGALFTVFLPLAEVEKMDQVTEVNRLPVKGSGRILFVDDEEIVANLAESILKRLGYKPTIKTSSREALEVFKGDPEAFDLVITDMAMPTMNGVVLTKELRSIRPDIPIILCTGYSDQIDERKAERLGINRLLDKPISLHEISRVIHNVLISNGNEF